jgi:hypothetical protein
MATTGASASQVIPAISTQVMGNPYGPCRDPLTTATQWNSSDLFRRRTDP